MPHFTGFSTAGSAALESIQAWPHCVAITGFVSGICARVQFGNASMRVCQPRWGRWPPSIRQVQWSDLRWPNSEGYRQSRRVIVSKPECHLKFPSSCLSWQHWREVSGGRDRGAPNVVQVWAFGSVAGIFKRINILYGRHIDNTGVSKSSRNVLWWKLRIVQAIKNI